jgi:hypothetical protein
MWVMETCRGFSETQIVNNWIVLGMSILIMTCVAKKAKKKKTNKREYLLLADHSRIATLGLCRYSFFIWVRFQRFSEHKKRPPFQVEKNKDRKEKREGRKGEKRRKEEKGRKGKEKKERKGKERKGRKEGRKEEEGRERKGK